MDKWVTTWKRASFFPFLYSAMSQRTLDLMLQRYYFLSLGLHPKIKKIMTDITKTITNRIRAIRMSQYNIK